MTAAAILCLLLVPSGALPHQSTTGRIAGVVSSTDPEPKPIRRALVTLTRVDLTGPARDWWAKAISDYPSVVTDDDGRFTFAGLVPGRYALAAAKAAYLSIEYGAAAPGRPGTSISVTAGAEVTNITLPLTRGGVIAGVVRDASGAAMPGVAVAASVRGAMGAAQNTVMTNDRGAYRLFGLAPGEYDVIAFPRMGMSMNTRMEVVADAEIDAALAALRRGATGPSTIGRASAPAPAFRSVAADAPVFYPGSANASQSIKISIDPGQERDGIDFPMALTGTIQIAGIVVGSNGTPVRGAAVSLEAGPNASVLGGLSGADGRFLLVNVSTGRYTVTARVTAFASAVAGGQRLTLNNLAPASSTATEWASVDVDAADTDLSGIVLTLGPAMTLSGTVRFEGTSLAPPANSSAVTVRLSRDGAAGTGSTQSGPDGRFVVAGLFPGSYRLSAISPIATQAGWSLRSAIHNGRDLLDYPLTVGDGGNVTGVTVTFTDRHTELTGVLQSAAGTAAPSFIVLAFPADRDLWNSPRRVASTRPATSGTFSFQDLPPGDYLLAVVPAVNQDLPRTPEFLSSVVTAALRVSLSEGERKTQDLRIARVP